MLTLHVHSGYVNIQFFRWHFLNIGPEVALLLLNARRVPKLFLHYVHIFWDGNPWTGQSKEDNHTDVWNTTCSICFTLMVIISYSDFICRYIWYYCMILVLHPFFLVSLLVNIVLTCWRGNILPPPVFSILHLFVLRYFNKHDIYVCVTSLCVHSFGYSRGYLPVPHRNHKTLW